jgi:hypothetical protein
MSDEGYRFGPDRLPKPMVLCFVDATPLVRLGVSTLVGMVSNNVGVELVVSYQVDRKLGRVLFTKSRVGTAGLVHGMPEVVAAFVGSAKLVRN